MDPRLQVRARSVRSLQGGDEATSKDACLGPLSPWEGPHLAGQGSGLQSSTGWGLGTCQHSE